MPPAHVSDRDRWPGHWREAGFSGTSFRCPHCILHAAMLRKASKPLQNKPGIILGTWLHGSQPAAGIVTGSWARLSLPSPAPPGAVSLLSQEENRREGKAFPCSGMFSLEIQRSSPGLRTTLLPSKGVVQGIAAPWGQPSPWVHAWCQDRAAWIPGAGRCPLPELGHPSLWFVQAACQWDPASHIPVGPGQPHTAGIGQATFNPFFIKDSEFPL